MNAKDSIIPNEIHNLNTNDFLRIDSDHVEEFRNEFNVHIITTIIWSLIAFVSVLANGCLLYTILKRRLAQHPFTGCYITNIALSDLIFSVTVIPLTILSYLPYEWLRGKCLCYSLNFVINSVVTATCLTYAVMTFSRYSAILNPNQLSNTSRSFKITIFIWIASFVISMPYLFYYNYVDSDKETYIIMDTSSFNDTTNISNYTEDEDTTFSTTSSCAASSTTKKLQMISTIVTITLTYVIPLLIILASFIQVFLKFECSVYTSLWLKSVQKVYRGSQNPLNGDDFLFNILFNISNTDSLLDPTDVEKLSFDSANHPNSKLIHTSSNKMSKWSIIREKRHRILFMIASVGIIFAILWIPVQFLYAWRVLFEDYFPLNDTMYKIKIAAHTLSYIMCCINPLFYFFMRNLSKSSYIH